MPIKRILIPIEDRDLTQATLSQLRPLLKHLTPEAILLRVVPPDESDLALRGERIDSAQRDLGQTCELLRASGFRATGDWVEGADPAAAIVDRARSLHASLIVQTTHAREDLERWSRGSVTERVLRCAPTPMLLFNPTNSLSRLGKILVPLDGSEHAERILPLVSAFASSYGSEVILLRVGVPKAGAADVAALRESLVESQRLLEESQLRVRVVVTLAHSVALAILDVAEGEGAELIAMTTHGETAKSWHFGSTADKIFRHSPLPLLVKRVAHLDPPALKLVAAPAPERQQGPASEPRRVLVPLDGSKLAAGVLKALPGLLRGRDAEVTLLRVVSGSTRNVDDVVSASRASLRGVARHLRGDALRVDVEVAQGEPAAQILQAVERLRPDLVVMSSHGRSGPARWIRGSVSERVLRSCAAPLLVLNTTSLSDLASEGGIPIRRILVPQDGSAFSAAVLPHAQELALVHNAEIVLFRVADRPEDEPHAVREAALDRLLLTLEEQRVQLEAAGVSTTVDIAFGKAANEILAAAGGADLVALSTHGRTGPARWLFGSVAELVLRHCARPLLVVRHRT